MWLKKLKYAFKQNAHFLTPSLRRTEPPIRPILLPPPRPHLRPPPPPPPFVLPPKKTKKHAFPQMLMQPPPRPPFGLTVPLRKQIYTEVNKQIYQRPQNLMIEITLTTCKNTLVHFPFTPKFKEDIARTPWIRVHGLRLCFLDDNNELCYLNHQNQKFLDEFSRIQESEAARSFILDDLRRNGYYELSIAELASIWYDDSGRSPVDFWIYQFLKHGYCAQDDPMPDYASQVGDVCLPLLMPTSSVVNYFDFLRPDFDGYDDFDEYDDEDLGSYLLREGFRTNEYHLAQDLRDAVTRFCNFRPSLDLFQSGRSRVFK